MNSPCQEFWIPVPRFGNSVEDEIADAMEAAASCRGEADDLENVVTARATEVIEGFLYLT